MKKVISFVLVFALLAGQLTPAQAQVLKNTAKGVSAAVTLGKAPLRPVKLPTTINTNGLHLAPNFSPAIYTQLERNISRAVLKQNTGLQQVRQALDLPDFKSLAEGILKAKHLPGHHNWLRTEYVTLALHGYTTAEQNIQASSYWKQDLTAKLPAVELLKDLSFSHVFQNHPDVLAQAAEGLTDASALALFGTREDLSVLEDFYHKAIGTPLALSAAANYARACLRLAEYDRLTAFSRETKGKYAALFQGIAQYAVLHKLPLSLPVTPAKEPFLNEALRSYLSTYGEPSALSADSSHSATVLWMNLTAPVSVRLPSFTAPAKQAPKPAVLSELTLTLDPLKTSPEQLNTGAVSHPTAGTETTVEAAPSVRLPEGDIAPVLDTPAQKTSLVQKVRNWLGLGKKKQATPAIEEPVKVNSALQRASLYLASAVMGLEVATPVISNFGTSFGLSLEDNILVAVATYFPYSVGAFFANYLKQKIGRKAALNLGLGLMGLGFLGGVTLCGLDGSFVPEANAMLHFYKTLACITIASVGGVLVHNSVGPMITEISKGESDLVLQKRNSYTELARAAGMAASFAFPFVSTAVLGLDWSLTFALPIPLVAAAAIGINSGRLPNTKPVKAPSLAEKTKASLWEKTKNSEYLRLFKEEKGVAPLLTGLLIMNAVEVSFNSGFLLLLPSLTQNPSMQYLFGIAQFAVPFLLGRYLAGHFLKWFPKNNMAIATALGALGGFASLTAAQSNVYLLTASLFAAELGISTAFTLAFSRTAKNPKTQDRIISLIVASAISCAFGPMLLTDLAQRFIDAGLLSTQGATAAALLGIPAVLASISALLFKRADKAAQNPLHVQPQPIEKNPTLWQKVRNFFKK